MCNPTARFGANCSTNLVHSAHWDLNVDRLHFDHWLHLFGLFDRWLSAVAAVTIVSTGVTPPCWTHCCHSVRPVLPRLYLSTTSQRILTKWTADVICCSSHFVQDIDVLLCHFRKPHPLPHPAAKDVIIQSDCDNFTFPDWTNSALLWIVITLTPMWL